MSLRTEREPGGEDSSKRLDSDTGEVDQESDEEKNNTLRPIKDIAQEVDLSVKRIQALLKDGKVEGELRPDEGYGKGLWYTSVANVREYQENLPTPKEFGRIGGLTAGRGRPKNT